MKVIYVGILFSLQGENEDTPLYVALQDFVNQAGDEFSDFAFLINIVYF